MSELTVSELIERLSQFKEQYGDLTVVGTTYMSTIARDFVPKKAYYYEDMDITDVNFFPDEDAVSVCELEANE
jgi:hypothetical protein